MSPAISAASHWITDPTAPWLRPGIVPRPALVDRLSASAAPVVLVVAPSGYGKTTLLAQWVADSNVDAVWVSLDERDDDPVTFLGHLTAALDAAVPGEQAGFGSLVSSTIPAATTASMRIGPAMASPSGRFVLVLDHLEKVRNQASVDAVVALAVSLPVGWRLAIASRNQPIMPVERMRAEGRLLEIGPVDLAMGEEDARSLLAAEGTEIGDADLATLLERTEGWPVGLYLTALASRGNDPGRTPAVGLRGDDRFLADYLRSEVLALLPADTVSFLTRTSILDHFTGPLCDAVLATQGSTQILRALENTNLLLVPVDRQRRTYRYHHLFQELLHDELTSTEAALVPELHARASAWFAANRLPELALVHAQAAGDADRAADLLAGLARPTFAAGRVNTVRRWLDWFEEHELINRYPQVALHGAWIEAHLGRSAASERWFAVAERASVEATLPDGSPWESYRAVVRALLCPHGVAQMRADAEFARQHLAPGSGVRGAAIGLEALSYLLTGDLEAADSGLAHAFDVARYASAAPTVASTMALRAWIAIERQDWAAAQSYSADALDLVEAGHLEGYHSAASALAVAARVDIHRGDLAQASARLARAAQLRPMFTYAMPWTALFLLQFAHAYLKLADPAGARTVLREVRDILRLRPDLGIVADREAELGRKIDALQLNAIGSSSLTAAELRLLPYLATHLSFREIGERLYVSRHTVKSQAVAIYRKLGVSSRSEAITRIQEIGLLAP